MNWGEKKLSFIFILWQENKNIQQKTIEKYRETIFTINRLNDYNMNDCDCDCVCGDANDWQSNNQHHTFT